MRECENSSYSDLLEEYKDIFHGLGEFAQVVKLELDPSIRPRQQAPRKTPIAIRDALISKIRQLERDGIIERVEKPTPWISNLVAVPKADGAIRITLDPCHLNKAIIRPRYPMPTLEEHLPLLAKAKIFSIVDAKDGFYQMQLHEDSTDLTCFWTPIGRFKYRARRRASAQQDAGL